MDLVPLILSVDSSIAASIRMFFILYIALDEGLNRVQKGIARYSSS